MAEHKNKSRLVEARKDMRVLRCAECGWVEERTPSKSTSYMGLVCPSCEAEMVQPDHTCLLPMPPPLIPRPPHPTTTCHRVVLTSRYIGC